jgi:hypothetical protein
MDLIGTPTKYVDLPQETHSDLHKGPLMGFFFDEWRRGDEGSAI